MSMDQRSAMADDYKVPHTKKVTPPTNDDIYDKATDEVTAWTSMVNPTPDATSKMEYTDSPTKQPKRYETDVTPPTTKDIYVDAANEVRKWPEIALDDAEATAENQKKEDEQLRT